MSGSHFFVPAHGHRRRFGALSLLVFALSAAFVAGGAQAKPSGPGPGNSPNAKACQKDGWKDLTRQDGSAFASEGDCTSYAARGNSLSEVPVNQAPAANPDFYSPTFFGALTVFAPGVLSNDTDSDGPNPLSAVLVSGPTNGILTFNTDGSFTYMPRTGSHSDSFTYRASDGALVSSIATVTITFP
jgi:hypothetical protein